MRASAFNLMQLSQFLCKTRQEMKQSISIVAVIFVLVGKREREREILPLVGLLS